ncbi:hypothetical protein GPALN_007812 [Globodera pallida]|nr:hypothetical protein GPALN_007812 [Globodera pallida]
MYWPYIVTAAEVDDERNRSASLLTPVSQATTDQQTISLVSSSSTAPVELQQQQRTTADTQQDERGEGGTVQLAPPAQAQPLKTKHRVHYVKAANPPGLVCPIFLHIAYRRMFFTSAANSTHPGNFCLAPKGLFGPFLIELDNG